MAAAAGLFNNGQWQWQCQLQARVTLTVYAMPEANSKQLQPD
jgi:hypothetical protein